MGTPYPRTLSMSLDAAAGRGSGLPNKVAPSETISRFVCSRKNMAPAHLRVKRKEFMPSGTPLGVSIFRTTGLDDSSVWAIGHEAIVDRAVLGRGDLSAGAVYDVGLSFDPDDVPPRHANIIGWPDEKEDQIALALQLEDATTLVMP